MAYFGRHTESFNASRTIKIPSTETVENYTVSGKIKIKKKEKQKQSDMQIIEIFTIARLTRTIIIGTGNTLLMSFLS